MNGELKGKFKGPVGTAFLFKAGLGQCVLSFVSNEFISHTPIAMD